MTLNASTLPADWEAALGSECKKPYFLDLQAFVAAERQAHQIFPPENEVFSAFHLTPYEKVRVVVLGQDPYHDVGQAHGLSFSVKPGVPAPPSLANIYKELKTDMGTKIPNNGYLVPWAEQGVLLLNAVMTVRAHTPNSHKDKGWESFTDATIQAVNAKKDAVIFVLWGKYAQKKEKLIDGKRHVIMMGAHPSPLSAKAGFFGSRPFSAINRELKARGFAEINWQIPNL